MGARTRRRVTHTTVRWMKRLRGAMDDAPRCVPLVRGDARTSRRPLPGRSLALMVFALCTAVPQPTQAQVPDTVRTPADSLPVPADSLQPVAQDTAVQDTVPP